MKAGDCDARQFDNAVDISAWLDLSKAKRGILKVLYRCRDGIL